MTNHPLTDEICNEIFKNNLQKTDDKYHEWQNRALRAAADWQLEEVISWIEATLNAGDVIAEDLKKAMRPQQQKKPDNTVQDEATDVWDTELIQRAIRYWENN